MFLPRVRYYFVFVITLCSLLLRVRYYFVFVITSCSILLRVRYYFVFVINLCSSLLRVRYYFVFVIISCSLLLRVRYTIVFYLTECIWTDPEQEYETRLRHITYNRCLPLLKVSFFGKKMLCQLFKPFDNLAKYWRSK